MPQDLFEAGPQSLADGSTWEKRKLTAAFARSSALSPVDTITS